MISLLLVGGIAIASYFMSRKRTPVQMAADDLRALLRKHGGAPDDVEMDDCIMLARPYGIAQENIRSFCMKVIKEVRK